MTIDKAVLDRIEALEAEVKALRNQYAPQDPHRPNQTVPFVPSVDLWRREYERHNEAAKRWAQTTPVPEAYFDNGIGY